MTIGLEDVGNREFFRKRLKAEISFQEYADKYPYWDNFILALTDKFPLDDWLGRELALWLELADQLASALLVETVGKTVAKVAVATTGDISDDTSGDTSGEGIGNTHIEQFNYERTGFKELSDRTALIVHCSDKPFLVDTIRICLNKASLSVYCSKSTLIDVQRNDNGEIDHLRLAGSDSVNISREALIYLEISRPSSELLATELSDSIDKTLKALDFVVSDYREMLGALRASAINLASHKPEQSEQIAFLHWLKDSHFTFLAYADVDYSQNSYDEDHQSGVLSIKSQLGLFRKECELDISSSVDFPVNQEFLNGVDSVEFLKCEYRSTVHRAVYPEIINVRKYDENGEVCGEYRFLGFYTYAVSSMSPQQIPIIRKKIDFVLQQSGLNISSHDGKRLVRVAELHPKIELLLSSDDNLRRDLLAISDIDERNVVRFVLRQQAGSKFSTGLVYVPRDLYSTRIRLKIQELVGTSLGASCEDATTFFSESNHARAYLLFKSDAPTCIELDVAKLEEKIYALVLGWSEHLSLGLRRRLGEKKGLAVFNEFQAAFPSGYQEQYNTELALADIEKILSLNGDNSIAMELHQINHDGDVKLSFRVLHLDSMIELSEVIPILENMGLRVLGEVPHNINAADKNVWIHDFSMRLTNDSPLAINKISDVFEQAFLASWFKRTQSDGFNRLVIAAGLSWREIAVLRAYANYAKQALFQLSVEFISDALYQYPIIAKHLVELFYLQFDPGVKLNDDSRQIARNELEAKILIFLDDISNLNQDQVFRHYLILIRHTLRSNYFQRDGSGHCKTYLSLKLNTRHIDGVPEPRPEFEVFVFSPRVEGVHLRSAKVARGGLRWSDRLEDYRTEVLGLVKAQQVKNSVIVPAGAKGGFVAKQIPLGASRAQTLAEGVECYKTFIRGLLDITDNSIKGEIIKPLDVVCRDGDDEYLVVAADKGTATFSDVANEISKEYGHWLGDAFASGGSEGYDHKKMGITAKGAWVSVQTHFREINKNIQNEDFTAVGIGDMAGDVFGNGMLLSKHIRLLAAFNHLHIFVDPNPDSASSFVERERLFNTPGCNWNDYSKDLISAGGGVFDRSAKSITISRPMKEVFSIDEDQLTPNQLMHTILKSEVELIWNGGIGTYVKSEREQHANVGDKANDALRVNGAELRCKVFGEGGNLGMTQLGRIEYALSGGACNTDFIDNAAGVDCSDHEVNIKILIDKLVEDNRITIDGRSELLSSMTDAVSEQVLDSNYRQSTAISFAQHQMSKRMTEYMRYIDALESDGQLDRALEFIPTNDELSERLAKGQVLTRPEISVLLSYSKVYLKGALIQSDLCEDEYCHSYVLKAFPNSLVNKYKHEALTHKLKRELVSTQLANDFVNKLGITALNRLTETTGAEVDELIKGFLVSSSIFELDEFLEYLKSTDNSLPSKMQFNLMGNFIRRTRRGVRWFLRNRRSGIQTAKEILQFKATMQEMREGLSDLVSPSELKRYEERSEHLRNIGISESWIPHLSMPDNLFSGLGVVEVARISRCDIKVSTQMFYCLLDQLRLEWFATQLSDLSVDNYWQAFAREAFIDDLEAQLRKLSIALLKHKGVREIEDILKIWKSQHVKLIERWDQMIHRVESAQQNDYSMFTVAIRELIDLAQATEQWKE
ncbi:MAG: glutamate dehydrogenase [Flavobacteriales bacterium]|jgi:glutamate dehydrogenase